MVNQMDNTAHGVAQLEAAFAAFSQISGTLESAYGRLEARVAELSSQLAAERSKRLAELNQKEQLANRLTLLMNLLPGGVVVLGETGEILEVNPRVHEWLGKNCVGQRWQQLIAPLESDTSDPTLLLLNSGVRVSVTLQPTPDGMGAILLLADVTRTFDTYERSSRESRLVALGEMAARLAHQIRTPLSSALLGLANASHAGIGDADRSRILARTGDRLRHMETLVGSMLSFVRGSEEGAVNNNVDEVLREVLTLLTPRVHAQNGSIVLAGESGRGKSVLAQHEAFVSVLVAIAENGLELAEQPTLVMTTSYSEHSVRIDLTDNGPGVSARDQSRIFEPFFSGRANGTGLGLAIASRFARELGGDLSLLDSSSAGSTFRLQLPVTSVADEFNGSHDEQH